MLCLGMIPPPNIPLPLQMNMPGVLPNMPRMVPPPTQIPHAIKTSQPSSISTSSITSVTNSANSAPLLSAVGNDSEKVTYRILISRSNDSVNFTDYNVLSILGQSDNASASTERRRNGYVASRTQKEYSSFEGSNCQKCCEKIVCHLLVDLRSYVNPWARCCSQF